MLMQVQQIKANKLRRPANDDREKRDKVTLESLSKDIMTHGIKHPLHVMPIPGEDAFEILTGVNRYLAGLMAGLSDFPCVVRTEPLSELEKLREKHAENTFRRSYTKAELAEMYSCFLRELGTQAKVAEYLGITAVEVSRVLNFKKYPPALQELVNQGKIGTSAAQKLCLIKDEAQLNEIAQKAIASGWKRDRLVREVNPIIGKTKTRKPRIIRVVWGCITLLIGVPDGQRLETFLTKLHAALKVLERNKLPLTSLPDLMKGD